MSIVRIVAGYNAVTRNVRRGRYTTYVIQMTSVAIFETFEHNPWRYDF